ncbi:MAG: hypothetical protein ACO2PN_18485 [Pyrobaculum sp.]
MWKAGRGYMAAAQTRDIAAVCTCAPPHSDGPSGHKAAHEGVYLVERAAEAVLAVLRTAAR